MAEEKLRSSWVANCKFSSVFVFEDVKSTEKRRKRTGRTHIIINILGIIFYL
jgi:hypothetical protein